MPEFSPSYLKWFKQQSRGASPPAFPRNLPGDSQTFFIKSSHANSGGRFAALATAAMLGREACDSAITVSLHDPVVPPPWMSHECARRYMRDGRCWDDLAESTELPEGFPVALRRVHHDTLVRSIADASVFEELPARLCKEFEDTFRDMRRVLESARFHAKMSAQTFNTLIGGNLLQLACIQHLYAFAGHKSGEEAVSSLLNEARHGLVLAIQASGVYQPHAAVVLTV